MKMKISIKVRYLQSYYMYVPYNGGYLPRSSLINLLTSPSRLRDQTEYTKYLENFISYLQLYNKPPRT